MELERHPEPLHIKEEVLKLIERHPETREEGGHSVADPISYWYGNKLPRYLWKGGWGPKLKEIGFDEDRFMRTIGAHRAGFLRWIDDEMPWEKLLDLLILSVTRTAESLRAKTGV
ncbi:MAG: hypothetical protein ACE5HJ_08885 [Thermoplasmata archaeon]